MKIVYFLIVKVHLRLTCNTFILKKIAERTKNEKENVFLVECIV